MTSWPVRRDGSSGLRNWSVTKSVLWIDLSENEHAWPVAPNLLAQDFEAEQRDRKWGADTSHIWRAQGWLYLAVVLDLHA